MGRDITRALGCGSSSGSEHGTRGTDGVPPHGRKGRGSLGGWGAERRGPTGPRGRWGDGWLASWVGLVARVGDGVWEGDGGELGICGPGGGRVAGGLCVDKDDVGDGKVLFVERHGLCACPGSPPGFVGLRPAACLDGDDGRRGFRDGGGRVWSSRSSRSVHSKSVSGHKGDGLGHVDGRRVLLDVGSRVGSLSPNKVCSVGGAKVIVVRV